MFAELALRGITSGFYGAITEAFSAARPVWAAVAAAMVVCLAESFAGVFGALAAGNAEAGLSIGASIECERAIWQTPLEAMASGLPVVVPRAGGVLSYADDGNAWPVQPAGEDFAAGVRAVFVDEAARSAKVELAIRTAAKLDWSHVAASCFDLYDGI